MFGLKLHLSPTHKGFKVIATTSEAGEGEFESSLPFFVNENGEGKNYRSTLLRCLEMVRFESRYFQEDEQEWMVTSGILDRDRRSFHPQYLANIGKSLFRFLFPPDSKIKNILLTCLRASERQNTQLHIQFSFSDNVTGESRLADYPWELLYDDRGFLLLKHNVTISRYIAYEGIPPNLSPTENINVLLLSSNASDAELKLSQLGDSELKAIRQGLQTAARDGHINFVQLTATRDKLRAYLNEHRGKDAPQVLHFDGHGLYGKRCYQCSAMNKGIKTNKCRKCGATLPEARGYLVFENKNGGADYVSADEFATLISKSTLGDSKNKSGGIALVLLSACQSAMTVEGESIFNGTAQSLISQRIPSVAAMQYSVSVASATKFAEQFYRSLGQKNSLGVAVSQAREAMGIEGNQWYRPVLYLRWRDNEGGRLFDNPQIKSEFEEAKSNSLPQRFNELINNQNVGIIPTPNRSARSLEEQQNTKQSTSSFPGAQVFDFTVVTINSQGKEIESHHQKAYCLTEEIGNKVILEMVYIPGGEFLIGSPESEGKRYSNERPQHLVTIKPFFISKYPITKIQWKQIALLPTVSHKIKLLPSRQGGNNHPVTHVSWLDAVEFCDRLSKKTGYKYRLPSEAEWEYACRAGTTTPFHFGETINSDVANYDNRYPYRSEPKGIYLKRTTEVGTFKLANSFGLFDMHGLVWEWCSDNWHQSYDTAPTNGDAWLDANNNTRMMRGGSWNSEAALCRSSSRQFHDENETFNNVGFRIIRSL